MMKDNKICQAAQELFGKNLLMPERILRYSIITLVLWQLIISSVSINKWFKGIIWTCRTYAYLPPQERVYSCPIEEYNFICNTNRYIPENANILWIPGNSMVSMYHIYPRKIFQKKEYAPDEKVIVEKEFLISRKINYVLFDYNAFFPIEDVKVAEYAADPRCVVLERK